MSAIAKEKIFDELRNYHADAFPAKLASDRMTGMKAEFGLIEDQIINMLLGLVNGKSGFVDQESELKKFRIRIETSTPSNPNEEGNRTQFVSKINRLTNILTFAKQTNFPLRKVRVKKVKKTA